MVFDQKGEEVTINVDPMATLDMIFPSFVKEAINHYHRKPNDMDRLRWLGQTLTEFFVLEWLYENFSEQIDGNISFF